MTKWHVPNELSERESKVASRIRKHSRFFLFLREVRGELFDADFQQELAMAYEPRGQEPVAPALLAMVMLLQAYTGSSDAEAVDAAEMDLRWQLVLGTLGSDKAPFGQGSLVRFRSRMVEHDFDQLLIDRTVELAKKTGKFGWQNLRVALDSSPLRGSGRVEDTWNLVGRAMSKLVSVLGKLTNVAETEIIAEARLTLLSGPSIKAMLDIDWDDAAERQGGLTRVLTEAESLLAWARRRAEHVLTQTAASEAVALLKRVVAQDTEPEPDDPGKSRIRKGVAEERVCSIGDTQMRHGRKSKSKAFNGYKRHIATSLDAPIIVGAVATPANQPEQKATQALLAAVYRHAGLGELFIDRGYLAAPEISKLSKSGVQIRCKPWPTPAKPGKFDKHAFQINLRKRTVSCPAGATTTYDRHNLTACFPPKLCGSCHLRSQCTDGKSGRSVQIHRQEALLRKLRHKARSSAGRKVLRQRVVVEHRLGRIQLLQGERARYKGQRKNTLDLRRYAAVANLMHLQPLIEAA